MGNKSQLCMCKDNITIEGTTLYVEVSHCSRGRSYLCGDATAVGDITMCGGDFQITIS
jgi:hypothetical protein